LLEVAKKIEEKKYKDYDAAILDGILTGGEDYIPALQFQRFKDKLEDKGKAKFIENALGEIEKALSTNTYESYDSLKKY
jgi:hypothetical protein